MESHILVELTYLLSAILFVVGLKRLQSPATARAGNAIAAFAMALAIGATVVDNQILSWTEILIGVAIGGIIGPRRRGRWSTPYPTARDAGLRRNRSRGAGCAPKPRRCNSA